MKLRHRQAYIRILQDHSYDLEGHYSQIYLTSLRKSFETWTIQIYQHGKACWKKLLQLKMPDYTSYGLDLKWIFPGMPRKDHASYCTWVQEIIQCRHTVTVKTSSRFCTYNFLSKKISITLAPLVPSMLDKITCKSKSV